MPSSSSLGGVFPWDKTSPSICKLCQCMQMTNRTSMPNIFIKGKSIGGCNDGPGVMTLKREGKLEPMLRQAGAL